MATIDVAVFGVDTFNNNSDISIADIDTYVESVWESEIEDGSGDYEAQFDSWAIEIPDSTACQSCSDYWERANDFDNWLQDNDNWCCYGSYDVIIIADYHDGNDAHHGVAQEIAGTSTNKVAIVNDKDLEGNSTWDPDGTQKVATHELLHMFIDNSDSEHYPHVNSNYEGTVMWDSGNVESNCWNNTDAGQVIDEVSSCTTSKVRTWIDNNM